MSNSLKNSNFSEEVLEHDLMRLVLKRALWIRAVFGFASIGLVLLIRWKIEETFPFIELIVVHLWMVISSLLGISLTQRYLAYRLLAGYFILETIAIQSFTIYFYGGVEARGLFFTYLFIINFSGIFSSRWPYVAANLSALIISSAMWLTYYGWLMQYNFQLHTPPIPGWFALVSTAMLFVFFNLGAFLTNVVLDVLRSKNRILK